MMKIKWIIFVLLICLVLLLFTNFSKATSYLTENSSWQVNLVAVHWSSTAFGDIDNDGDLDLILTGCNKTSQTTCSSYNSKIYINNRTSLVENISWQQNLTAVNRGSLAFGDIDNDGDLDLALIGCSSGGGNSVCNAGGRRAFIYINNGTSLIENVTWQQNLTKVFHGSVDFGDIDNDGDLDLALSGSSSGGKISKVYLNNGTSFKESTTWQQNLKGVYRGYLIFSDIDNDGDLDLALVGDDGTHTNAKSYLNNGTSLVESTTWQQNLLGVRWGSLSFGDYDNDGDLDTTIIGHTTQDNHRFYNNTGSTFIEIEKESVSGGKLFGIFDGSQAFGDYDNNGYLDLITMGSETHTIFYKNNNANFTDYREDPESHITNLEYCGTVVWSDVDNDTDLDLIITGFDAVNGRHTKIYTNNITTTNTQPEPPNVFVNYTRSDGKIHIGWTNGSDSETSTNGLYYNLKFGITNSGHEIISGIYGGGEDNGYFGNMFQRKNITLSAVRLSPNTDYYWSIQTIDTGLMKSAWSAEQTFTTQGDLTKPTITFKSPVNYFNTSSTTVIFNATVYDNIKVKNVSLFGNWSGWHLNETNSSGVNNTDYFFTKNLASSGDGIYKWGIKSCDNSSICEITGNRTFTIDTTYPYVYERAPTNESTKTTSPNVVFTYNVTDLTVDNCSLIIDNNISKTNSGITEKTNQSFTYSLNNGEHNWYINCTDVVGYTNSSRIYTVTINYNPPTGGASSTSTKGTSTTTTITQITTTPKSIPVSKTQSTQISIGSTTHTISIIKLTKTSVTIKINPTPTLLTLSIGETKSIILDNQKISITLDKIQNSKAYLSFNLVEEPKEEKTQIEKPQESKPSAIQTIKQISQKPFSYFSIILILALLVIIYLYYKKSKKQPWWLKGN